MKFPKFKREIRLSNEDEKVVFFASPQEVDRFDRETLNRYLTYASIAAVIILATWIVLSTAQ